MQITEKICVPYVFYILNYSDIFLFNISKYHFNGKLFHKIELSFKIATPRQYITLLGSMMGHTTFEKCHGLLPNLVRENLQKSGNLIIQNHWSPYFDISWLFSGKLIVGKTNKRNVFRPFSTKK